MNSDYKKHFVQNNLIQWYTMNQRILPWRQNQDPYRIWVSEIMLQQTRVEAVIEYYKNFLSLFPTVHALAAAEEEKILHAWAGLGYYSRARNLQKTAKQIVEKYEGIFPTTKKELLDLPGIGPYTCGAILSIAFNQPYAAVDGNVIRVLSRIECIEKNTNDKNAIKEIEALATCYIPQGKASVFNQALMELGALICIPKSPRCEICPLQPQCSAYTKDIQQSLPIKNKKKPQITHEVIYGIIKMQNKLLIQKGSEKGLLAGLWKLPTLEWESDLPKELEFKNSMKKIYNLDLHYENKNCSTQHIFTHKIWNISAYVYTMEEAPLLNEDEFKWISVHALDDYAFPTAYKKVFKNMIL